MEGATEAEIKQWVGHRDSRVVELYRHFSDDDSPKRLARLNLLGMDMTADGPQSVSSGLDSEAGQPAESQA